MTIIGGFSQGYESFVTVLETTNINTVVWLNMGKDSEDIYWLLRIKSLRVLILENLDI
jgi:hypothetical protein